MLITDATSLPRLLRCNGSRLMQAALPPEDNRDARSEGNAADWLASEGFSGVDIDALCNTKAPNGWVITSDMVDHVWSYLKALDWGEMQAVTTFGNDRWEVRARADHVKYINEVEYINGGNGNVLEHDNFVLYVDDLKYGHRIVEPEDNWTLIAHAIGYCIRHSVSPQDICLRIHQPRPYHPDGKVREWRLTYAELMQRYATLDQTLSNPSDMLNTGSWCHCCPAEPTCPAARLASYNAIDASELAYNDTLPVDVLNHEIDTLERAQSVISSRLDALTELAMHRISQGEPNPQRAVEQRRGQTRFRTGYTGPFLTAMTGVDCTKPGIITPAEYLRRGGSQASYDALTERPLTGKKLVRVDADTRARRLLGKE